MPISHASLANAIRALAMDAVEQAKSGHPGMPMGMADVATVLWTRFLKYDPQHPDWPDRDRFVLSAGHGSMLLYALLYLTGYPDMTLDELRRFRQLGARTAGHPEFGHAFGIETTTGPLGQGLANAVGMALAERHLAARFGDELVDHHTYVIAGDGCLMEGISHEAASLAGHLRPRPPDRPVRRQRHLDRRADLARRLRRPDHALQRLWLAHRRRRRARPGGDRARHRGRARRDRPAVADRLPHGDRQGCAHQGRQGLGARRAAGCHARSRARAPRWTGRTRRSRCPRRSWRPGAPPARAGAGAYAAWHAAPRGRTRPSCARPSTAPSPASCRRDLATTVNDYKRKLSAERPAPATRKASQMALEVLTEAVPAMVGGSADLTHSNLTNTAATTPITPGEYGGRYVSYGVREHAMVAAMNGMAVHGGIIPYGGTFLVFADYCRPALRLAALMRQRVIFVATHDSIGLGEDGPTHQPVEHLASLRAIPNMLVFRPADAVETAECWELALRQAEGPSVLALTRQELADAAHRAHRREPVRPRRLPAGRRRRAARRHHPRHRLRGASGAGGARAARPARASRRRWCRCRAGSCSTGRTRPTARPCWARAPRVAVEAASPFGWTRYIASEADFVGMTGFGASGPAKQLYEHFGITAEHVAQKARALVGRVRQPGE